MKPRNPTIAILVLAAAVEASAGSLTADGTWSPSDCGENPTAPGLDQSTIDAFNASLGAVNEWRRKAQAYNECMVKEANADNAIIARTANEEQAKFRKTVDQINTDAAAIKQSLEGN